MFCTCSIRGAAVSGLPSPLKSSNPFARFSGIPMNVTEEDQMRKSTRGTLYFAHPISLYGTLVERVIASTLQGHGFAVVNPGADEFQREYAARRQTYPHEHPMDYWLRLAGTCTSCAFCTFPNGVEAPDVSITTLPRVGAGVAKEVDSFRIKGKPVWWVSPDFKRVEDISLVPFRRWTGFRRLTIKETAELLRLQGIG